MCSDAQRLLKRLRGAHLNVLTDLAEVDWPQEAVQVRRHMHDHPAYGIRSQLRDIGLPGHSSFSLRWLDAHFTSTELIDSAFSEALGACIKMFFQHTRERVSE